MPTNHRQTLVRCFWNLPKRMRANLRWHAKQRTPILCGRRAHDYIDGEGAG